MTYNGILTYWVMNLTCSRIYLGHRQVTDIYSEESRTTRTALKDILSIYLLHFLLLIFFYYFIWVYNSLTLYIILLFSYCYEPFFLLNIMWMHVYPWYTLLKLCQFNIYCSVDSIKTIYVANFKKIQSLS